ncbi:MAG: universal stress protein, partial [candidate division NC10 bacterium]
GAAEWKSDTSEEAEVPFARNTFDGKNWERLVEDINASNYDLVVLGSDATGTVEEPRLGSVAERVAREGQASVLVVRTGKTG